MAGDSCTLCLHVSLDEVNLGLKLEIIFNLFFYSGFDQIMPANRIKALLGLHKISEYKNQESGDNSIDDLPYEIEFRNIVVHPDYRCKHPDNDIGWYSALFVFVFYLSFNCIFFYF